MQRRTRQAQRGLAYASRLTRHKPGSWLLEVSGQAESIELATTAPERLRGMLFRDPDDVTRILVPCRDIHTFGMRYPLDIAFIAKDGNVIEVHRNVGMRKRLKNRYASMVAERFSREGEWLHVGDVVRLGSSAMSPSERAVQS